MSKGKTYLPLLTTNGPISHGETTCEDVIQHIKSCPTCYSRLVENFNPKPQSFTPQSFTSQSSQQQQTNLIDKMLYMSLGSIVIAVVVTFLLSRLLNPSAAYASTRAGFMGD